MPNQRTLARELVVMMKPDVGLRAKAAGIASLAGVDVSHLSQTIDAAGALLRPLFDTTEDRLEKAHATLAAAGIQVPALSHYYRVHADDGKLDALAHALAASPLVMAAYVKPAATLAGLNDMTPKSAPAPATTPDFSARQLYLDPAPGGVDARFAWTVPGGSGAGVRIIDIEVAWNFAHEDLLVNQGGVVAGVPGTDADSINHGTAAVGVFSGDGTGITGICRAADVTGIAPTGGLSTAAAIHSAADRLAAGDIILIELQRAGPRFGTPPAGRGNLPLEWWPDDFDAILYATGKGVIVVEAAGNGYENLDDAFYDAPLAGFPVTWSNPLRRAARDSGAILVGAGAPPLLTHGNTWGPDRSRQDFSNYGSAVDVQGWGREVTTTGYGDLQGGANANTWYTDNFAGTSSASAMLAGVLGCVQGVAKASGAARTPSQARALLRATGSPQQDNLPQFPATQRIGNRPDLRQLLGALGTETDVPQPLYRYRDAQIPDYFYTTNWNELGAGNAAWSYQGIACRVHLAAIPGTVPLYRYWNSLLGDHFFTTDYSEIGAGKYGWVLEGVGCYVHDQPVAGAVPLYRYWNSQGRDHYYTTNWSELGNGQGGWLLEKIQCYVHT